MTTAEHGSFKAQESSPQSGKEQNQSSFFTTLMGLLLRPHLDWCAEYSLQQMFSECYRCWLFSTCSMSCRVF